MAILTRRVSLLEEMMIELTRNVNRLSIEMSEFKDEMSEFKDEMSEFKDEMRRDRRESKMEMSRFEDEMERDRKILRRSIAKMSQKMGTMAEDIIAPSIPRVLREVTGCLEEPEMLGVRIRKRLPDGRVKEYDAIAVCGDYLLINETKSRLRPEDISRFVKHLPHAREFLPEYADKQVIGALATFYVDSSLIAHGERQGLIMLGMDQAMAEVLNTDDFTPKSY